MAAVVLLGPQRRAPVLREVIADLGFRGPFALVTAGWKERELEDDELKEAIGGSAVNLGLYGRAEAVAKRDAELAAALRRRQDRLREMQELYRWRLSNAMDAARRLMSTTSQDPELIEPERESALEAVRHLDRHHLARVEEEHRSFERRWQLHARDALARERSALAQQVLDAEAVLVAGGHVAVLLGRLRLFDLGPALRHKPVIAWAAGALVASERVVLFHDSPPQGPGHSEVLDRGLGLCSGVLPLPDAGSRLRLDDSLRVSIFARRFFDLRPATLDSTARLDWVPPEWQPKNAVRTLSSDGQVAPWGAT
jgi:hypothetical protein